MSYTGVTINGTDTLEEWGLILEGDLTIGEAKLKETWVDVPGANGALNLSYVTTDGEPVYEMREISFTLFASGLGRSGGSLTHGTPPDEAAVNLIRTQLQGLYHGREVELILPDDPTHFFKGVLSVGAKSKFNSGRIPITVKAYPYRLKNTLTQVEMISGYNPDQDLVNNGLIRVVPEVRVTFDESNPPISIRIYKVSPSPTQSWTILQSQNYTEQYPYLRGLYLYPGTTSIHMEPNQNNNRVIFTYREGRL